MITVTYEQAAAAPAASADGYQTKATDQCQRMMFNARRIRQEKNTADCK
jgi:hypothetical protein